MRKNAPLAQRIENFELILRNGNVTLIRKMWNEDKELRLWFQGVTNPSKKEFAAGFELILATGCTDIIDEIWKNSAWLQNTYSGLEVDFASPTGMDYKSLLPNDEIENDLIDIFEQALKYSSLVATTILTKNLMLRDLIIKGTPYRLYQEPYSLSPERRVAFFEMALENGCLAIANDMWEELKNSYNYSVTSFFDGVDPSKIDINPELIKVFRLAWKGGNNTVISDLWTMNKPLLLRWFNGEAVNGSTITPDELEAYFEFALTKQHTDMIESIWASSSQLREKYSSQHISFERLRTNFKHALSSKATKVSTDIWNTSPIIQEWFQYGESNRLRIFNSGFIANFTLVLESGNSFILREICANPVRLKSALPKYTQQEALLTHILRRIQEIDSIKKLVVLFKRNVVAQVLEQEEFANMRDVINQTIKDQIKKKSKRKLSRINIFSAGHRERSRKAKGRKRKHDGTWDKETTEATQNPNAEGQSVLTESAPLLSSIDSSAADGLAAPPSSPMLQFRLFGDPAIPVEDADALDDYDHYLTLNN